MPQLAYFGKKKLKKKIVKRAKKHQDAGAIVQGVYGKWEVIKPGVAEFRGCNLGCFLQPTKWAIITNGFTDSREADLWAKSNGVPNPQDSGKPHEKLEEKLNFSPYFSAIIESIFETLDPEDAKYWPLEIAEAISIEADVSTDRMIELIYDHEEIRNTLFEAWNRIGCPDYFDNFREDNYSDEEVKATPKLAAKILIDYVS
jgi:hypothetical protein